MSDRSFCPAARVVRMDLVDVECTCVARGHPLIPAFPLLSDGPRLIRLELDLRKLPFDTQTVSWTMRLRKLENNAKFELVLDPNLEVPSQRIWPQGQTVG